MKKLCLLGASVLAALTISACSVSVGGEGTFKLEGDDLEGAQSVLDVYFEETLKQTNMTVTMSLGTDAQFKEEIDGTSDFTAFGSEANSYSFVDGADRYIYAYSSVEGKNYMVGKDFYNMGISQWKKMIPLDLSEGKFPENAVYYAKFEGTETDSGKNHKSSGTFELSVTYGEGLYFKANGKNEDGLVTTVTLESKTLDEDNQETTAQKLTATFTYGEASLTNPDLTDWTDITPDK